jgi:virginiamycin B lyase
VRNRFLNYKKNNNILIFSVFILSNTSFFLIYFHIDEFPFNLSIKNIQGQLPQQQQTDYIQYHYQSDLIREFEIPVINNNETGLKGITTDSKDNVWFYHNTNTSSVIIEFNPVNNTFTKYPILNKTNVDSAITNLAGGQIIFDETRNLIWFSDARTNSLGRLNITDKQIDLYNIPTNNSGIMGITLSPDNKSIWFAEIIGNNIGSFDIESNNILEYPTGISTGPTLLTFDNDGFLWSSLSYSNEILRVEPYMVIPGMELNGMLRIKLPEPDIFSPFGLSVISHNNETNTLFVSDHGSSRIIAIPTYNEKILNEHIQNYTPYWTSPSKFFPNTLPSEIVSDKEGNIYFAEHGGNRIAKFSTDTKTMTEYDIPTGPLATTVFISLSNDNTKVWFTEWASNQIGYLDITKQIPFKMLLDNGSLSSYDKPITFTNNTSYQTNVSLIRNNLTLKNQSGNVQLNNISLSVAGMTDSGPKGITYSFNPQRINLTENNKENSLLTLMMVNDDVMRSENNTLMVIGNTFKNNITTSILQPLPISIIKSDDSSSGSSSFPSSTLEETNTNYNNFNTLENSNTSPKLELIDIIKYLSLSIAIILIGFIIYKRIKNRNITKKK